MSVSRRSLITRSQSRALLRNKRGECLIIRPRGSAVDRPWELPGGPLERAERPEAALQRHCCGQLGINVEIVAAPRPITQSLGAHTVSYCFFVCAIVDGAPRAATGLTLRWVLPGQLREYHFDSPMQRIIDWLLDSGEAP